MDNIGKYGKAVFKCQNENCHDGPCEWVTADIWCPVIKEGLCPVQGKTVWVKVEL